MKIYHFSVLRSDVTILDNAHLCVKAPTIADACLAVTVAIVNHNYGKPGYLLSDSRLVAISEVK